jgi:hypothetical protein
MSERRRLATWMGLRGAAGAICALALAACAGGAKQADSPGTCPEGTVLRGEDCVPPEAAGDSKPSKSSKGDDSEKFDDSAPAAASAQGKGDDSPSSGSSSSSSSSPSTSSSGGKTPYDRDAVEVQLKRAARQIKSACGSATDDDGKATGPWGSTKVNVVLGRNGHIKGVTVPAPYDGKPVGVCVQHAFEKLWFPPYASSSDVSVDWDVEIVPPKKR